MLLLYKWPGFYLQNKMKVIWHHFILGDYCKFSRITIPFLTAQDFFSHWFKHEKHIKRLEIQPLVRLPRISFLSTFLTASNTLSAASLSSATRQAHNSTGRRAPSPPQRGNAPLELRYLHWLPDPPLSVYSPFLPCLLLSGGRWNRPCIIYSVDNGHLALKTNKQKTPTQTKELMTPNVKHLNNRGDSRNRT